MARGQSLNLIKLQFTDEASCRHWIESLPLTNVQSAQRSLTLQLATLRQAGVAPSKLFRILEILREPIHYVQGELARKYSAKPLPLDAGATALWTQAASLWQELVDCYLTCRDAHVHGDLPLRNCGAIIVMRALRYTGTLMFEHYRIYRQVPGHLWHDLHRLYVFAEESGFLRTPVVDSFSPDAPESNCGAAYCRALLAHMANPFALSGRQMEFVARWIEQWSGLLSVASQPLPSSAIPPLAVDVAASTGPFLLAGREASLSMRYLDVEAIGRSLRQTMTLLKQGHTPAQLGLGDDARQPGCENLVMLLYIQWCRAGTGRGEQRDTVTEKAQVCLGIHAAHFYIGGRAFRMPGSSLTPEEESDMQMFGHISDRTEVMLASGQSAAVESWELMNQSNSGFMCMLRDTDAETRIAHNQLVAVRRASNRHFNLGLVQWLRVEETEQLSVGVRLLPGMARAVVARPANFIAPSGINGCERALLLPEIVAPATPLSLILPTGWYQAGRFIDIFDERKHVARLGTLLEKGSDFDRCAVTFV